MLSYKQMPLEPAENSPYNAKTVLYSGAIALQRAGIGTASLDARILLQHMLGVTREELLENEKRVLTHGQYLAYQELIDGRLKRKPVSQLTGRREFWGMAFKVTEDTLDPRPDSETLIEAVLSKYSDRDRTLRILDLGTGTGCLLLTLLSEYKNATGLGIDISEAALQVARENAQSLGIKIRAKFMQSRWAEKIPETAGKQMTGFDIIISNPPYIPTGDIAALEPEVSEHEPMSALDGGKDGLTAYREIMPQLRHLLADDGLGVFEIGMGQEESVKEIVARCALRVVGVHADLSGVPRCVMVTKTNEQRATSN